MSSADASTSGVAYASTYFASRRRWSEWIRGNTSLKRSQMDKLEGQFNLNNPDVEWCDRCNRLTLAAVPPHESNEIVSVEWSDDVVVAASNVVDTAVNNVVDTGEATMTDVASVDTSRTSAAFREDGKLCFLCWFLNEMQLDELMDRVARLHHNTTDALLSDALTSQLQRWREQAALRPDDLSSKATMSQKFDYNRAWRRWFVVEMRRWYVAVAIAELIAARYRLHVAGANNVANATNLSLDALEAQREAFNAMRYELQLFSDVHTHERHQWQRATSFVADNTALCPIHNCLSDWLPTFYCYDTSCGRCRDPKAVAAMNAEF